MAHQNAIFLSVIGAKARKEILDAIATHYNISAQEVLTEVSSEDAEHLLDYMVEPQRSAASVLMQRHGLR